MYPHERSLVKKMQNKPFALIGINSDSDLNKVRPRLEAESITWRSFWNGPRGTDGPISKAWNVNAWPTLYLLDHEGVIRFKSVGFDQKGVDAAIAKWVPIAEKAQGDNREEREERR